MNRLLLVILVGAMLPSGCGGDDAGPGAAAIEEGLCRQVLTDSDVEQILGASPQSVESSVEDRIRAPFVTCVVQVPGSIQPVTSASIRFMVRVDLPPGDMAELEQQIAGGDAEAVEGLGVLAAWDGVTSSLDVYLREDVRLSLELFGNAASDEDFRRQLEALAAPAVANLEALLA